MAIVKVNNYGTENNLTNVALNVDYDRLQEDKTDISINYGTSPATVTVNVGSIIEVNGNRYVVQTSSESFQMDNVAHDYLTVTDDGGTDSDPLTFGSASTIGMYDSAKQGYYQSDNVTKTLKFYVDQSGETFLNLIELSNPNTLPITTKLFDRLRVYNSAAVTATGVITFDTTDFDELSRWDAVNYRLTIVEAGCYSVSLTVTVSGGSYAIRKNGVNDALVVGFSTNTTFHTIIECVKDDYIDFYFTKNVNNIASNRTQTYATIARLL